jgi:hypothetical protein
VSQVAQADDRGSFPDRGERFLSLAFVSRSAPPSVTGGSFLQGHGVMLATHHYLVPRSRMSRSYNSSLLKRLRGVSETSFTLAFLET